MIQHLPLTEKEQLISYFVQGCKPKDQWRIGTEHEKFVFYTDSLKPVPYETKKGIGAFLKQMTQFGWDTISEEGNIIALTKQDGSSVTLEPGGQFELSGAPLKTIHETCKEVHQHLDQVKTVGSALGISMIGMGFSPKWSRDDFHWMPKPRYRIMKKYMPTKGNLGLDMMLRSCTIQANLDFSSEEDMIKKFRVSLALQPLVTALFANSPFSEGKPNGYVSYRSAIWEDTDPDRCGLLDFVFKEDFSFEKYVDYALDVPMYFVKRNNQYIDAAGLSFRDFMKQKLDILPGETPLLSDWEDHLTTLFPEVRMKKFLEMRGADGGPWRRICALPALWAGLLYDETALEACHDMIKGWTIEEMQYLRHTAPKEGFQTKFRKTNIIELCQTMISIADEGLKNRACYDDFGEDERHFLNALKILLEEERTPAERKIEIYNKAGQNIDELYRKCAY